MMMKFTSVCIFISNGTLDTDSVKTALCTTASQAFQFGCTRTDIGSWVRWGNKFGWVTWVM